MQNEIIKNREVSREVGRLLTASHRCLEHWNEYASLRRRRKEPWLYHQGFHADSFEIGAESPSPTFGLPGVLVLRDVQFIE